MKYVASCIVAVMLLCGPGKAYAIPVLDQSFNGPLSGGGIGSTAPMAQTFTVGLSGVLTGVDLQIGPGPSNSVAVEILSTNLGVPVDFAPLASLSVPNPNNLFAFTHFDFSSFGIAVNAGDMLAIGVRSLDPTMGVGFNGSSASQGVPMYNGGSGWSRTGPGNTWQLVSSLFPTVGEEDFHFRTYIEAGAANGGTSAVPEPSTLLLLGSGMVGLGLTRLRKFRKNA